GVLGEQLSQLLRPGDQAAALMLGDRPGRIATGAGNEGQPVFVGVAQGAQLSLYIDWPAEQRRVELVADKNDAPLQVAAKMIDETGQRLRRGATVRRVG